jgi:dTDP-glucose pyrophosphorylase
MKRLRDIEPFLVGEEVPLREALARLNNTSLLCQIVVDRSGRLVGTLTDGDVRRAILRGVSLEARVKEAANSTPVIAHLDHLIEAGAQLSQVRGLHVFVPALDESGVPREIWATSRANEDGFTALVMAGGRGTRLGLLTQSTPKPLVQVGGKPILEHVLSRLEAAGATDIHVSINYLGDQIEAYCASRNSSATLHMVREDLPTGTAGALSLLPPSVDGPVMVVNGDLVTDIDFRAFVSFFEAQRLAACVAVAHHEIMIPYGVVEADLNGTFQGIQEKPVIKSFVAAGIYMLDSLVYRLVQPNQKLDMPDLLQEARVAGLKVGIFPIHEYWKDVGRPADLAGADADLRARSADA